MLATVKSSFEPILNIAPLIIYIFNTRQPVASLFLLTVMIMFILFLLNINITSKPNRLYATDIIV